MGSEVVNGFLSQLGSLGASHTVPFFQFVFCFNWEKSKLENTLLRIRALISDLEKKQETSDSEQHWRTTLRDICNEGRQLVDQIDEGQRQVHVNGNMAAKVLCFLSHLPFYSAMACKMKRLRERLNAAAEDYTKFPPLQQVEGSTDKRKQTKETTPYSEQDTKVIGREMDEKAIKTLIKESGYKENVLIIPITGTGGLGKTTLARSVFNDKEVFDLKMWVWVGSVFDVKTLVKKVIRASTKEECPDSEMDLLQHRLREELDGKKYLLVLDDVWETNRERWMEFQHLLMGGARGSLILVTTRHNDAGRFMSNTGEPYKLEALSSDYSWSLFEQKAFKTELMKQNLVQLRPVGKEILEKCGGNPLAITTVARLLSDRHTYPEWLEVKNLLWELAEEDTDILPILRISYQHLSTHLQKCFAHCTLFRKGYRIKKATLIQLWMAGELIQPSKKRILEDIGEEYFKTLLNRNFFEDEEMDECDNITSCKMHDLMHDLAQTAAGMDNYSIIMNDDDGAEIPKSVIHASISEVLWQFPTSILNAKNLRTFLSTVSYSDVGGGLVFGSWDNSKGRTEISKGNFDNFALTCKSLRVLGLLGFRWWDKYPKDEENFKLPNSNVLDPIGKLKQLRYLDLSYSDITTLPNSVCELQNLQTLKLRRCDFLTELPRDIKELKNLRHLDNFGCRRLKGIPCGIGQLTCIQTLPLFVLGEGAGLSELETLNNLRGDSEIKLHKSAATSVDFRKAFLKEKQYLQTLKLDWLGRSLESNGVEDAASLEALQPNPNLKDLRIVAYGGVCFPSWMLNMGNSLPYLVQISLFYCQRCVRFPLFADLRCLKELHLFALDSLENIDSCISDSSSSLSSSFKGWFPSLKKVNIKRLPKLKEWTRVVNDGRNAKTEAVAEQPTQQLLSLNSLEILKIVQCPELTSMPLHPNVEQLELNDVSGVLIESMTKAATVSPTAAATSLLPSSFTFSKLKWLQIICCKDLVSLGGGWLGNLTSLKRLAISDCPELNFSDEDNDMPVLRSLRWLELRALPKLAALPKVFQHSTALETLEIAECPGLMTFPDWFGKLTSLRELRISHCSELKSPGEGWLENLTSLTYLFIWNCPELNFSDEDNDMPVLRSLRVLRLSCLPKLAALPKGLQHSTALDILEIQNCPGLMTLPDWFGKLTPLRELKISDCSELKSLPEGMHRLTALEELCIGGCPHLSKTCRKETGKDWLKIAHIPKISINGKLL